jgi:3D (Asp-Asp-Asp) domain-containing protein
MFKIKAAAMALMATLSMSSAADAAMQHEVKSGDTLYKVGQSHGITVEDMIGANTQLVDPNLIYIGEVLNVPTKETAVAPKAAPAAGGTYKVQKGDTIMHIADRYGIDFENVLAVNKGIDPDRLQIGQLLNIPAGAKERSTAPSNSGSSTSEVWEVTAFTAGFESTGKRPGDAGYGITASGATVTEGRTIACPPELPFGTKVTVPKLGTTYTCEDRGGAIKGKHIDVYMSSLERARAWGSQMIEIIIHR